MVLGSLVLAGALGWAFVWQPLVRDLERLRGAASADAATLAHARALSDDIAGLSRATPPARAELRAAVARALDERGLRAPAVAIEPQGDRVKVLFAAVPFAALIAALDAVRKDAAAFVVEGTITPLVQAGSVRADVVLAR